MRTLADQSNKDGNGCGLFLMPDDVNPGDDYERYGALWETITTQQRAKLASQLGVPVVLSTTIADAIEEVLTLRGRPEGDTFAKPLLPDHNGNMVIRLGDFYRRFNLRRKPELWQNVMETYRQSIVAARAAGEDVTLLRKYVGALILKLGGDYQQFGLAADEIPIAPSTTVSDDFNRANAATLGAGWTDVVNGYIIYSNAAQSKTAGADNSRFDSDVSTDDHYAEADVVAHNASNCQPGVAARYSSTAETFYQAENRQATTTDQGIRKWVTGTSTYIVNSDSQVITPTYTLRSECDGSTISCKVDGIVRAQVTDTAITGFTRGGFRTYGSNAGTRYDNFQVTDLIAAANQRGRPRMQVFGN